MLPWGMVFEKIVSVWNCFGTLKRKSWNGRHAEKQNYLLGAVMDVLSCSQGWKRRLYYFYGLDRLLFDYWRNVFVWIKCQWKWQGQVTGTCCVFWWETREELLKGLFWWLHSFLLLARQWWGDGQGFREILCLCCEQSAKVDAHLIAMECLEKGLR